MTGALSTAEIDAVLQNQLIGRLGCHANGVTYIVPISYAYDGTFLYGHSAEGRKITMLRENPAICFQTDVMPDMGNWQSIICWGQFEELKEEADRLQAVQLLSARQFPLVSSRNMHLNSSWPFHSSDIREVTGVLFRIRLTEKTGRYERS